MVSFFTFAVVHQKLPTVNISKIAEIFTQQVDCSKIRRNLPRAQKLLRRDFAALVRILSTNLML